jgi:hypothetical protein
MENEKIKEREEAAYLLDKRIRSITSILASMNTNINMIPLFLKVKVKDLTQNHIPSISIFYSSIVCFGSIFDTSFSNEFLTKIKSILAKHIEAGDYDSNLVGVNIIEKGS